MSADNKTAMRVAHWNGASWSALGAGIEPLDYSHDGSTVYALARRANGDIVAGGRFSNAGTVPARNVARWNGHEWRPLGKGLNGTVDQLRSLTNGDLVACGWFTMAGDNASVRWARWTDRNEPIVIRNPADSHNSCGETSAFGIDLAAGYSDVSYIWRRNGVPISTGNTRYSVRSTPIRSELTIEHTSPSDAGVFDCVVSRSCGVSLSTPCELIVAGLCCPADLTSDGVVDDADFCVFAQAYDIVMCESQAMPRSCPADLNADALVDDSDFLLFVIGYFEIGCP